MGLFNKKRISFKNNPGLFCITDSSADNKFNCNKQCFIEVLNCLHDIVKLFDWDNTELPYRKKYDKALQLYNGDMMGDINEYFKNDYGGSGKGLGQFFTPPSLGTVINQGLKFSQLIKDSKNLVLADPCMGSTCLVNNYYLNNSLKLHGGEIDPDTIKWAKQSILLNTGEISEKLHIGDSIINNKIPKGNRITNPPFKISMKYSQEKKHMKLNMEKIINQILKIFIH